MCFNINEINENRWQCISNEFKNSGWISEYTRPRILRKNNNIIKENFNSIAEHLEYLTDIPIENIQYTEAYEENGGSGWVIFDLSKFDIFDAKEKLEGEIRESAKHALDEG